MFSKLLLTYLHLHMYSILSISYCNSERNEKLQSETMRYRGDVKSPVANICVLLWSRIFVTLFFNVDRAGHTDHKCMLLCRIKNNFCDKESLEENFWLVFPIDVFMHAFYASGTRNNLC